LNIVDADIRALQKAAKRGRVRSDETQQLIDAIDGLVPGKAKAIVLPKGEKPERVRARISYAAKFVAKKLLIAVTGDRVMFALKEEKRRRGRPRKNPG
jgi:hypothetical protein